MGRRPMASLAGKQKGNALLTDIRTRMDVDAADSPVTSPRNADVDLPAVPGRKRRTGGSLTPLNQPDQPRARGGRTSTRLRREVSPARAESASGDDNETPAGGTPVRDSPARESPSRESPARESADDSASEEEEEGEGKTRRTRKPAHAPDGTIAQQSTAQRRRGVPSAWSTQEKDMFLEQLAAVGKNYAAIAGAIGTKSAAQCRNYFQNRIRQKDTKFVEIAAAAEARTKDVKLAKKEEKKKTKEAGGSKAMEVESNPAPPRTESGMVSFLHPTKFMPGANCYFCSGIMNLP